MQVTTTANSVTVTIPNATECFNNTFCNKITRACESTKSYIKDRAHAITHPTCRGFKGFCTRLAIGSGLGLTIAGVYALAVSEGKLNNLTEEQRKIFAISYFGVCMPTITLLADIGFYIIENR